jgi:hypothetical protein
VQGFATPRRVVDGDRTLAGFRVDLRSVGQGGLRARLVR